MRLKKALTLAAAVVAATGFIGPFSPLAAQISRPNLKATASNFSKAVAFDRSAPVRSMPQALPHIPLPFETDIRREGGPIAPDRGFSGSTRQSSKLKAGTTLTIPSPILTFEGVSNEDNFNIFGGRVSPPDPVGDVGPNHYVEMANLAFSVYDKAGNKLLGPVDTGTLWAGFAVDDCTDPSGDPVVLYDHLTDRWLLSQFTTRGLGDPTLPFYNCVAISVTGDPTGEYYRYAFTSGFFFPDYPKYSSWPKSFVLTSRDFGPTVEYGISIYALEKDKMIAGDPNARAVKFFLDSDIIPVALMGDGLLPADFDGHHLPSSNSPIPIIGTMDDGGPYGAPFDALNVWEMSIKWRANPQASLTLADILEVEPFDSIFPCPPTGRSCIPEPGVTDPARWIDILSYRQRATYRLAYRKFNTYASMVTNQSVEAAPGVAGIRWYEIRRDASGYSVYQQGTYNPGDGVHRWMGSAAMDRKGNIALGYSVSNATDVYPGIRYTGRLKNDPLGEMTLGEGTIIDGSGSQVSAFNRWGDYTSMNVDPTDDCTFWYVNEYYQVTGIIGVNTAPWQTRVGAFRMPNCGTH